MNPKKPKDIAEEYAQREGIPVEDLNLMLKGFYREVKDRMENFGNSAQPADVIDIQGLGRMRIGITKLNKDIAKLDKFLNLKTYRRKLMTEERVQLKKMKKCQKHHKEQVRQLQLTVKRRKIYKAFKEKGNDAGRETTEGME